MSFGRPIALESNVRDVTFTKSFDLAPPPVARTALPVSTITSRMVMSSGSVTALTTTVIGGSTATPQVKGK